MSAIAIVWQVQIEATKVRIFTLTTKFSSRKNDRPPNFIPFVPSLVLSISNYA